MSAVRALSSNFFVRVTKSRTRGGDGIAVVRRRAMRRVH